jgi:hypothetical protein
MKRLALVATLLAAGVLSAVLLPAEHASAAPSLHLSRTYLAPGDAVTVQGYGFTAGDDVVVGVTVTNGGHSQRITSSTAADTNGNFSTTLTIPHGAAQGTVTVDARDFHAHVATQNLTIYPLAYVVPGGKVYTVYVIPGHAFFVTGSGFQPSETVNLSAAFPLYDGNTTTYNHSAQADSHGNLSEVFVRVPRDAKAGATSLKVTGQTSNKSGQNMLRVFYRPSLLYSGTVRPGTPVLIRGREFVPNSTVHLNLTIPRAGVGNVNLSRDITSDGSGNFNTTISLPSDVQLGHYTITAVDSVGGFRASAGVLVSVKPTIAVQPYALYPGEAVTVSGDNFGSGSYVTISATFPIQGGGTRTVSVVTRTGGKGNYSAHLPVPAGAAPGKVMVTAHASNASVRAQIQVNQKPAPKPTATPVPSATATPVPPTATPTATLPSPKKHHGFGFRYISVWYHTVRAGTYNHLVIQSTLHTTLGIWVHIWFPNVGQSIAIYTNTDASGFWQTQFNVPGNAITSGSDHVLVTFRLWHGKANVKDFSGFRLVH